MAEPIAQYLERYAEPEARALPEGRWEQVVVVPLHRESARFLDGLQSLATLGSTLLIAVVNARDGDAPRVHDHHRALLDALRQGQGRGDDASPTRHGSLDVWTVDRATPGRVLPDGQGVGLARKIGLDMALALWRGGQISSPWLRTTDADASAVVTTATQPPAVGTVAQVAPFWHAPSGEPALDQATSLYELWLRYYVAGLAWAGSPWAFPTIGSTLSVHGEAYAMVRGVPRRQAGEDFHLLAKLAKLGMVAHGGPVEVTLQTRASDRVPFGTGPGAQRWRETLERGQTVRFYDPRVFAALRAALRALDQLAEQPSSAPYILAGLESEAGAALWGLGVERAVVAASTLRDPGRRRRRIHEWFDALRTLQFIHRVRDAGLREIPWPEAIDLAPFVEGDVPASAPSLDSLRRRLANLAPPRTGIATLQ